MTTVRVPLGERSYDIQIQPGSLARLGAAVSAVVPKARRALVISDSNVAPHYLATAEASLAAAGITAAGAVVPAGESAKSLTEAARLYEACLDAGLERSGVVVALGGGVVGDLAGFVAATYLRGVAFVQVPTSLLAMVDASVGGKVAVDLPRGKNLVGAFHQPRLVLIDPSVLATLPPRQVSAGLAEVVKHGVIRDGAFLTWLEDHAPTVLAREADTMEHLIASNCRIKAAVVTADEREETGLRAILNFGHTTGHAIEAVQGYGGWLHGEAVAAGMCVATRVAAGSGVLQDEALADRLAGLLARFGLPVSLPAGVDPAALMAAMQYDKKAEGGRVQWVLPVRPGEVARAPVEIEIVTAALAALKA